MCLLPERAGVSADAVRCCGVSREGEHCQEITYNSGKHLLREPDPSGCRSSGRQYTVLRKITCVEKREGSLFFAIIWETNGWLGWHDKGNVSYWASLAFCSFYCVNKGESKFWERKLLEIVSSNMNQRIAMRCFAMQFENNWIDFYFKPPWNKFWWYWPAFRWIWLRQWIQDELPRGILT